MSSAPVLAPVVPRVISPQSGESLPLTDVVRDLLADNSPGRVAVVGPPGCGKSTALQHLAADLLKDPPESPWQVLEGTQPQGQLPEVTSGRLVIYEAHLTPHHWSVIPLPLCRWGRDEVIEYLLARHPPQCASVVARISTFDALDGSPLLWPRVLDELANHPGLRDVDKGLPRGSTLGHLAAVADERDLMAALERVIDREFREQLQVPRLIEAAERFCLMALLREDSATVDMQLLSQAGCPHSTLQFLWQSAVQIHCAARYLTRNLRTTQCQELWQKSLPTDILRGLADRLRSMPSELNWLESLLWRTDATARHASAASILHAARPGWRPGKRLGHANLSKAQLAGVKWSKLNLREARLQGANFSHAELTGCDLQRAFLFRTQFQDAEMQRARLMAAEASQADFADAKLQGANLSEAQLNGASFAGAQLANADFVKVKANGANFCDAIGWGANFRGAQLSGSDFSGASFSEADFSFATLSDCDLRDCDLGGVNLENANLLRTNLEGVRWKGARLKKSWLTSALLTGSQMRLADLRLANLQAAGLGEIDWERADLRGADLRCVSFHMGSTREGLLFSPIACEGSKTGFYTDDYFDQSFKAPEEIRKANLRGADLRGANIEDVDFYLVDLRDAAYDDSQRGQLMKTGAILSR